MQWATFSDARCLRLQNRTAAEWNSASVAIARSCHRQVVEGVASQSSGGSAAPRTPVFGFRCRCPAERPQAGGDRSRVRPPVATGGHRCNAGARRTSLCGSGDPPTDVWPSTAKAGFRKCRHLRPARPWCRTRNATKSSASRQTPAASLGDHRDRCAAPATRRSPAPPSRTARPTPAAPAPHAPRPARTANRSPAAPRRARRPPAGSPVRPDCPASTPAPAAAG